MESALIRLFPDAILRRTAEKVTRFDASLLTLIQLMDQTMRRQPHGIGIAAPQIGVSLQVVIVDVSARVPETNRWIMINAEILRMDKERLSREGCMSLPDYTADLKRYDSIHVRWQDESAKYHTRHFEGIEAICIQHELDHLQGILFLDRVSCLKTDMYPRSLKRKKNSSNRSVSGPKGGIK